ncbi:hypothetical protein NW754_009654 [Fusarium falciforme]|nr:hypothetical protein NW754_009654 [Fusarium falciforme]
MVVLVLGVVIMVVAVVLVIIVVTIVACVAVPVELYNSHTRTPRALPVARKKIHPRPGHDEPNGGESGANLDKSTPDIDGSPPKRRHLHLAVDNEDDDDDDCPVPDPVSD